MPTPVSRASHTRRQQPTRQEGCIVALLYRQPSQRDAEIEATRFHAALNQVFVGVAMLSLLLAPILSARA
jgi:hypothetical protein